MEQVHRLCRETDCLIIVALYLSINTAIYTSVYTKITKYYVLHPAHQHLYELPEQETSGTQLNQLDTPYGIFVNDNLTLYIADYYNHRVQMWTYGASTGIRVAGDWNIWS